MPSLDGLVGLGFDGGSESESEPETVAEEGVDGRGFGGEESLDFGAGFERPPPRRPTLEIWGALETGGDPSDELEEVCRAACCISGDASSDLGFLLGCLFMVCVSHD